MSKSDKKLDILTATLDLSNYFYENTPLPTYEFNYAKVVKVYDGDTFWIVADNHGKIFKYPVRLFGCDCAEIRGGNEESKAKAQQAKKFVSDMLLNKIVKIEVLNGRKIDGKIINEKYGRLIAKVEFLKDDKFCDLTTELLNQNLAYTYHGGTKTKHDE